MLVCEFQSILDIKMYVLIGQKYPLFVQLSQHASAVSSLIKADWPLHYIIQNFKQFFLPPLKF